MRIIVPMAGMGKRMRPHTLTTPKPLLPIAGKPIVQRLLEGISEACPEKIEEVAFVTGNYGKETEDYLKKIASDLGAEGTIYYQNAPLGTAHAILSARNSLKGKVVIAFADTLFHTDMKIDLKNDGIIWVQKVKDPKAFGVIKIDKSGLITGFVEKPEQFVSDLAIIGIYYFRDGALLEGELQYLIDGNIKDKGEFQLTSAMENMRSKGIRFVAQEVKEWLDCGNKDSTVYANQRVLELSRENGVVPESSRSSNSIIIEPCYIGENVTILNSVVGPHVSIGNNSTIEDSVIRNSIVQTHTRVSGVNIQNSMLGNYVHLVNQRSELNIGDYNSHSYINKEQ